jgi:hypothetical protein
VCSCMVDRYDLGQRYGITSAGNVARHSAAQEALRNGDIPTFRRVGPVSVSRHSRSKVIGFRACVYRQPRPTGRLNCEMSFAQIVIVLIGNILAEVA